MTATALHPTGAPVRTTPRSPARLLGAPRLLVTQEQVRAQLELAGESAAGASVESEDLYNGYAALLLCFTPKKTPTAHDPVTAPGHDELTGHLEVLTGERLPYAQAVAVGRALGLEAPSMPSREARWLFSVCQEKATKRYGEITTRPRDWVELEERLGIYVEFRQRYAAPGLELVAIHRADPRVAASAHPGVEEIFSGKLLEFGGDWAAISRGLEHGFTGRDHRLAIELMTRLDDYDYAWSPRLVRDTFELVVHDRRYRLSAFPGAEPGKVRLRIGQCVPMPGSS